MEVRFAGRDGKILHCNESVIRITTPKGLFRKEEFVEFQTDTVVKAEVFEGANHVNIKGATVRDVLVFWQSSTIIVGFVLLRPENLKLVEIILRFFKKRDAETAQRERDEHIRYLKQHRVDTYVAGTQYHATAVKRVFSKMRDTALYIYDSATNKELLECGEGEVAYELDRYSNKVKAILIKEPENEFDSEAIRVSVDINSAPQIVGYVPKAVLTKVHKHWDAITEVEVMPVGGKYKIVEENEVGELKVRIEEDEYRLDLQVNFSEIVNSEY